MAVQYDSANGWTTWLDVFKKKLPEVSREADNFFNSYIKNGENLTQIINDFSQDGEFDGFIKGSKLADKTLISFLRTKSEKATLPCSFSPSNQIIPKIEMPTSGGAIIISYFSFMFHLTNQSFLNQFNMVL